MFEFSLRAETRNILRSTSEPASYVPWKLNAINTFYEQKRVGELVKGNFATELPVASSRPAGVLYVD